MKQKFIGKYKIIKMEMWDREYIDLVVPGYVEICKMDMLNFNLGLLKVAVIIVIIIAEILVLDGMVAVNVMKQAVNLI